MEKRAMVVQKGQWAQTIADVKQRDWPIIWRAEYGVAVSSSYKWQRNGREKLGLPC